MVRVIPPTAVVMNMFYTGLGIARSLGEQGVPVIGLTSQRGIYGNFTRYAKTARCRDSRNEPEALLDCLIRIGQEIGHRSVIFPTRDDDVVFLDRFRSELEPYFKLTVPQSYALNVCLSKWETFLLARRTHVPTPKCWSVDGEENLRQVISEITYPCVLKPVASHHWRKGANWDVVGHRKAIRVSSPQELFKEYSGISRAESRVLIQEMVPGSDDCLFIAACYLDRESNWVAGFNAQKLLQHPEGFGTGCIVQTADCPELREPTMRLLQTIGFSGVAEVEYKWDASRKEYQLIEINPRPWDQHRLGRCVGTDLIYFAYCEHAGLQRPIATPQRRKGASHKWIAEDALMHDLLRIVWRRDARLTGLKKMLSGQRTYGIWSVKDPLPFLAYLVVQAIPVVVASGVRSIWSALKRAANGRRNHAKWRSQL